MFPLPHPLKLHQKSNEDQAFLKQLYYSRRTDLQQMNAPKEMIDQLISLQQMMQIKAYEQQFPDAQYWIVYADQQAIGQIIMDATKSYLHLVDIALLPVFQQRGIGRQLLQAIISYASELSFYVHLSVAKNNTAAKNLYTAVGFMLCSENEVIENMIWNYR